MTVAYGAIPVVPMRPIVTDWLVWEDSAQNVKVDEYLRMYCD